MGKRTRRSSRKRALRPTCRCMKKGWLTREACQTDKRAFEVDLTDEGRRIIQAAIPPHQRAIEETFSVLTPEEQAQLVELLKKFKNV